MNIMKRSSKRMILFVLIPFGQPRDFLGSFVVCVCVHVWRSALHILAILQQSTTFPSSAGQMNCASVSLRIAFASVHMGHRKYWRTVQGHNLSVNTAYNYIQKNTHTQAHRRAGQIARLRGCINQFDINVKDSAIPNKIDIRRSRVSSQSSVINLCILCNLKLFIWDLIAYTDVDKSSRIWYLCALTQTHIQWHVV